MYDEAYFAPLWELGFLCAAGPRVAVSGLGMILLHAYSAPYEEVCLKSSEVVCLTLSGPYADVPLKT